MNGKPFCDETAQAVEYLYFSSPTFIYYYNANRIDRVKLRVMDFSKDLRFHSTTVEFFNITITVGLT